MGMDTSRSLKRLMLQSVKWRNEQPPFMGIDRYKSVWGGIGVDKCKRSHVGIYLDIRVCRSTVAPPTFL